MKNKVTIQRIVFDMDNTLVDEFGATLRPGIVDFLEQLTSMNCELYLWTNSSRVRAREILGHHRLDRYFVKFVYREDYDPQNRGVKKDIRKISGELLVDDDPAEIAFVRKLGLKGVLVAPYRKNMKTDGGEYGEILKLIPGRGGILRRMLGF